jgi:hypothetical protein
VSRCTVLRRSALVLVLSLAITLPATLPLTSVRATSPCDGIQGDPPHGGGGPLIGGQITNSQSMAGISGATVQLYRCVDQAGAYVTATTTGSGGDYAFSSLADGYYYVLAPLTGPLSGMQPASGTANPSAIIAVGDGDSAVDMSFQ